MQDHRQRLALRQRELCFQQPLLLLKLWLFPVQIQPDFSDCDQVPAPLAEQRIQ
ncbi:hypothetical protein D3C73_1671460 [compost metagenome]